jgi:hypothetical protein
MLMQVSIRDFQSALEKSWMPTFVGKTYLGVAATIETTFGHQALCSVGDPLPMTDAFLHPIDRIEPRDHNGEPAIDVDADGLWFMTHSRTAALAAE